MQTRINYIDSLKAEWIKSKSSAVSGLILFCVALVIGTAITANYLDVYNRVAINTNPWIRYFLSGMAIYVLFILTPFSILLIGAITYIEDKANGWKFMYTLGVSRTQTYVSKLLNLTLLIFLTSTIIGILLFLSGYFINIILPEYEFTYYSPDIAYLFKTIGKAVLSCLGAIGFQYMISILTKNVILSLGIGVFGYIIAFIFAFSDVAAVVYNPYALVMINQDFGAIDSNYKKDLIDGWLTNVELYSLLFFIAFTTIGCVYEKRRNIN